MTHNPRAVAGLRQAFTFAERLHWRGFDPYDGLLSPLVRLPLIGGSRWFRLALTQGVKRSSFNLRPLFGITKGINPKALALFLSSAARAGNELSLYVKPLAVALEETKSRFHTGMSWGYNFPWQARAFYLPAGTPTVVATSFAGEAFLDAHATTGESRYLSNALEACNFILRSLNRTEDASGVCLSYSPLDRTAVYNASLLGARLLTLTGLRSGRRDLIEEAAPLVSYVLAKQREDGAWVYGGARFHQWIDSFHTGFILRALDIYRTATSDPRTESAVRRGATFYWHSFFGPAGEPYFAPNRKYPLDIHSAAEGVLALLQLRDVELSYGDRGATVARWMMNNLLDPRGYFYYQIRRGYRMRTPFMRWSQAWGVRALAELVRCGVSV